MVVRAACSFDLRSLAVCGYCLVHAVAADGPAAGDVEPLTGIIRGIYLTRARIPLFRSLLANSCGLATLLQVRAVR